MSNTLWVVPLEAVQGRYTKQWYDNIPPALEHAGFDVRVIDGEQKTDQLGVGTFLDIHTTIHYKNSQMQRIAALFAEGEVREGDKFFFFDLEFWGGVEAVRLLSQMNKIKVEIFAFLHAASYTVGDAFAVAADHQKYTEVGWIAACDKVFVGSQYHKDAVIERRLKPIAQSGSELAQLKNKIIVTGNPQFSNDYEACGDKKRKQIILPNRFDIEKHPHLSLNLAYLLKMRIPDLNIVVTTGQKVFRSNKKWLDDLARGYHQDGIIEIYENLTKPEYHHILATSKIMMSNSPEENFGICIYEAMVYNTIPLLRNCCSHSELVGGFKEFLYDDLDQVVDKVEYLLETKDNAYARHFEGRVNWYNDSIKRIIKEMS